MRLMFLILCVWSLSLGSAWSQEAAEDSAPKPLPQLALLDLEGNETGLEAYEGQVLVMNFWATWCAPCRHEMPSLSRLQAMFEDQEMTVLAVSADRQSVPAEKLEAFMSELDIDNLTILRAADFSIMQQLEIPGLPATLLIDKQGAEVGRVLGIAEWDAAEPVEAVETLLAQPAS